MRHNHCLTSQNYRRKVREIDEKLAERYANHPAVLGWHISNELSGSPCTCPSCRQGFSDWCRKKYGTVEKLNHEWWTTFWSHTFDSFEQIEPPSPLGDTYNGLYVDYMRYITDEVCSFFENEKSAIRTYSDLPVTTNIMWRHHGINYEKLTALCDFVSWDAYPRWHSDTEGVDDAHMAAQFSIMHDRCRCYLGKPFALMESTPSLVSAHPYNKLKRPGVNRLACLEAVAHGADTVQYFQFHKSRGGHEALHGAVVDHSPFTEQTRVYREVASIGNTLEKIREIVGSTVSSRVALLYDMENQWALSVKPGFARNDKKYVETVDRLYYELWRRAVSVDVIDPHKDLTKYDLVIAPMLYTLEERVIRRFADYVRGGGTLVSGYMLGMVNENDLCYLDGFPGGELKEVFGLWNEEIDTLYPLDRNGVCYRGNVYPVKDYCERIHPREGATVLGTYTEDFYANEPAVVENAYGNGRAYYVATRDAGGLFSALMDDILPKLGIKGALDGLPEGVTAHVRTDGNTEYVFIENYNKTERSLTLPEGLQNMETDTPVPKNAVLAPYGVMVCRRNR